MTTKKAYKGMAMEGIIARWYARISNKEERHKQVAEKLASRIPPGGQVLEIAPGPGYFSIELARLGDFQVTGLDISNTFVDMVRENARKAGVQIDFRQGNASDMPFANGSFDFTFCQAAFKNFTEPVKAIAEMYRVLRARGCSVIIDLRSDASTYEIERYVDRLWLAPLNRLMTKWTFQHILLKNAYTITEMKTIVSQTPFQQCRIDTDDIGFTLWLEK